MEQGVPHLRIKKLKKSDLPRLSQGNNNNTDEYLMAKTYSSGFNTNKKKKIRILPSTAKENKNKSTSRKKTNENKENKNQTDNPNEENKEKKNEVEAKILFQSYGDSSDFVNKDYEFNNKNEKSNEKNGKKLSGIIEEKIN